MELEIKRTGRGFARADFMDRYGSECSIQDSSLANEAAVWLGVQKDFEGNASTRMHLTQDMVAALLPALRRFVQNGSVALAETLAPTSPTSSKQLHARAIQIGDQVVPEYRNGKRSFSCGSHTAKRWQAAYDAALAVLQQLQARPGS